MYFSCMSKCVLIFSSDGLFVLCCYMCLFFSIGLFSGGKLYGYIFGVLFFVHSFSFLFLFDFLYAFCFSM